MKPLEPYLSLVVTARNDNHGGNLLGRMQIFVNGWITQARRHNLSSELIIVEWNPPVDSERLRDALEWPDDFGPCDVRFIEVPAELHQRYSNATALALYQMIAKNVGIRRARGRFILATNIDILFSDELVAFLAEHRLQHGSMYRIDRHDVMCDVPAAVPVEKQLEYCRSHLLRVNVREGTFPVSPDGRRTVCKTDIAALDSGVSFGQGWYPPENYRDDEIFRWIEDDAHFDVELPLSMPQAALRIELEPGPGMGQRPMLLQVFDGSKSILEAEIQRRTVLQVPLAGAAAERSLRLSIRGGGDPVAYDPRILNCRVFSCALEPASELAVAGIVPTVRALGIRKRIYIAWLRLQALVARIAESGPLMTITVPISPAARRIAAFYVSRGGLTGMVRKRLGVVPRESLELSRQPIGQSATRPGTVPVMTFLHTNACGDFTLAAREHWFDLRGYPEFDQFSMNIDSVFCYALHHGGAREEVLPEPMRIYHIEHGTGSGWTPEGQAALFERIAAKGLTFVSYQDVTGWAAQMRRLNCPMIFNHENWGLSDFELEEYGPQPGSVQPPVRCGAEPE